MTVTLFLVKNPVFKRHVPRCRHAFRHPGESPGRSPGRWPGRCRRVHSRCDWTRFQFVLSF
jgi:hypothetical protein